MKDGKQWESNLQGPTLHACLIESFSILEKKCKIAISLYLKFDFHLIHQNLYEREC